MATKVKVDRDLCTCYTKIKSIDTNVSFSKKKKKKDM
jgi:hypothetical protein